MKVIKTVENRPSFRKGQLTMQPESRGWQDATWPWLKKNIKPGYPSYLEVRVLVWTPDGKAAHQELGQSFEPNSLAGAKTYARELVKQGYASMTEVVAKIHIPWENRDAIAFHFESYELAP